MDPREEKLKYLSESVRRNLFECILPVWRDHSEDSVNGGFLGRINEDLSPDHSYSKALVLMTRELWTFSKAYKLTSEERYAELADRCFEFINSRFWDERYGGVYFDITSDGYPLELEKRTYAQAFLVYSFSEYYLARGRREALDRAVFLFGKLTDHVRTPDGAYIDTTGRDWVVDPLGAIWWMNPGGTPLLLNSQLHVFESMISLYQASGCEGVKDRLRELLSFLMTRAYDREHCCLKAGMDMAGNRLDDEICYGHDAEFSYLLTGAADLLGGEELKAQASETALAIADHIVREGTDPVYGGVWFDYHYESGVLNRCKVWWNQAEALTALVNAYQLSGEERFLDAACGIWRYIDENLVDRKYGEWFAVGPYTYSGPADILHQQARAKRVGREKASRVKCPYHSSRCCMEVMARTEKLLEEIK